MKLRTPLTIAGVVLFGAFATGCSQQQTSDSSQNVDAAPAAPAPAAPEAPAQAGNCHTHAENASRGTTKHCHPHPNGGNHSHLYGDGGGAQQPNVADMQARLKAKGYYKGDITGAMNADTKAALEAYQAAH